MTHSDDPQERSDDRPIVGDPLIAAPIASDEVLPPIAPSTAVPVAPPPAPDELNDVDEDGGVEGGSKIKAAALIAGAAALANKVRQEAPKMVQGIREKRAAGRCVIVTEANGEALAIGPFKDDEAARQDLFKVGGSPRIVELVSTAAFFDEGAGTAD